MARLAAAMQGTDPVAAFDALLRETKSLSFLRMGDGELRFLLEAQTGDRSDTDYLLASQPSLSGRVKGAAANRVADYQRVLNAYENCDLLDLHLHLAFNRDHLSSLQWQRRQDAWQSTNAEDSKILPRWFATYFRDYVTDHKCLFFAGEAPLQAALLQDPIYRRCAATMWSEQYQADFLPLPNFGRHLSRDYDVMQKTLETAIQTHHYDTLFIGASGLAKPLCVAIAQSQQIKAIDIGSILRGLTYSATAGDATWPANHNPYYFSVPLSVYMEATGKAYPHLAPHELIAKANAQLCFDLSHDKSSTTSRNTSLTPMSVDADQCKIFLENYHYYHQELVPKLRNIAADHRYIKAQILELHWWMKGNGFSNLMPWTARIHLLLDRLRKRLRLKSSTP